RDWSSGVCSSDLHRNQPGKQDRRGGRGKVVHFKWLHLQEGAIGFKNSIGESRKGNTEVSYSVERSLHRRQPPSQDDDGHQQEWRTRAQPSARRMPKLRVDNLLRFFAETPVRRRSP